MEIPQVFSDTGLGLELAAGHMPGNPPAQIASSNFDTQPSNSRMIEQNLFP
jgi:hypothetical protein